MRWQYRANLLYHLGFPELAAADVYKALQLTNAALDYQSYLGERVRVHYGMYLQSSKWSKWDVGDLNFEIQLFC